MKLLKNLLLAASIAGSLHSAPAFACDNNPFLAQTCPVAFNFAPRGWAPAQGQLLPIASNQALFSILGTIYGGDGRTTFALPDTRGRVVIGAGQGPGLSDYRLGAKGGLERVTLTVAEMPAHSHGASTTVNATVNIDVAAQIHASSGRANKAAPTGNYLATSPRTNKLYSAYDANLPQVAMNTDSVDYSVAAFNVNASGTTTLGLTGGGGSHENLAPSLGMYWVIAVTGTFPSRS